MSTTTGATKKSDQQHQRRPEEQGEVDPLPSQLGAREVGHGESWLSPERGALVPSLGPIRTSRTLSCG